MSRKKSNTGLRFQPAGGNRAAQVPVGKKQRLVIERVAGDGRGIAFSEGRTWFVSGALSGEDVEARVLAARGKVVEARLERVFQASAERREAPCRHYARCGGCNLQHLPHDGQLALKQRLLAEQLQRVAGVQPEEWAVPLSGPEFGYRRRAWSRYAGMPRRASWTWGSAPRPARTLSASMSARCWYSPCRRSCVTCQPCCAA